MAAMQTEKRIQRFIELTKEKFGLDRYFLYRQSFKRDVNHFNETEYTFCMEWFPNDVAIPEEDDLNPEGSAIIDLNLATQHFENVIFVKGKTFAEDGIVFENSNRDQIIKWVEQETGLLYGKQFQLNKEVENRISFSGCIDGIAVYPSSSIEIEWNPEGKLTLFSMYGLFPTEEMGRKETGTPSLEKVEHLLLEKLQLVKFPLERPIPIYSMEEMFITNDGESSLPIEVYSKKKPYVEIGKTMNWDVPIDAPFERKEISLVKEVTAEQAFSGEPSPDSLPITKLEQEKCIVAVEHFLRKVYPDDAGKWRLETLHREYEFIHGTLHEKDQQDNVVQRKINVIIDATDFKVINYSDNQSMLEAFNLPLQLDKINVTKEEAFEKLRHKFELKTCYVFDFNKQKYLLCGKLACHYVVNAENGEVDLFYALK